MKLKDKLLSIAATIALFASPVFAGTQYISGKVVTSTYVSSYAYEDVPVQRCYNVSENRPSNGGDVLTGMIVGALIGKGAVGTDQGAAVGAVIGGVIAGDNNSRHSSRQVCETVWERQQVYRGGQYETVIMLDTGGYQTFFTERRYGYNERVSFPITLH